MRAPRMKSIGKVVLFGSTLFIVLFFAANTVWTLHGTDEWKLEIDRDGVQVYSYKESGSYNKIFKSVMNTDFTPSQIVGSLVMDNNSLDNCKEWIPECKELKVIEPYSDKMQGDVVLWTLELMPGLFKNREYLIKTHANEKSDTKVVTIDVMAGGNKIPLNNKTVRITHIHNRWQMTPLDNGHIELQLIQDFSMGGFFPNFLLNLVGAREAHKLFAEQLPKLVDKERYRNARFDYISQR